MLLIRNKIKSLLQHGKLLKISFLMISGVFFTTVNASLSNTNDQFNQPEIDSYYFLDIDSLRPTHNPDSIIYTEKEDTSAEWVVLPIKSSMRDYYKTVANVVATELHRRIDEHSLVPRTKFLIGKNMDDNSGYQLLGCVYKKVPSVTTPILEVMRKKGLGDYVNNAVYKDHNIERNVGIWNCLGLSISPDFALLEMTEDNKFIRYDYYNSFQHYRPVMPKKCFCTSYFKISDYECNVEYIKIFEQELRSKYKEILEKIISEINGDSKKYLAGGDLLEINQALNIINSKF